MRGRAELVVVSQVEMTGDEGPHLQQVIRSLREGNDRSGKGVSLSQMDVDLLRRFDEAMDEANAQANRELQRLRPIDDIRDEPWEQ